MINSDKLSRSYDDLYIFRRHFWDTGMRDVKGII